MFSAVTCFITSSAIHAVNGSLKIGTEFQTLDVIVLLSVFGLQLLSLLSTFTTIKWLSILMIWGLPSPIVHWLCSRFLWPDKSLRFLASELTMAYLAMMLSLFTHSMSAAITLPIYIALLAAYSYEVWSFTVAVVQPTVTSKLSEHSTLQHTILSAFVLSCKLMQALAALTIGADLGSTHCGQFLLSFAVLALSVTPVIITQHYESDSLSRRGGIITDEAEDSPPTLVSPCGGSTVSRVMDVGDLYRITESRESGYSPYASTCGQDLMLVMSSLTISNVINLARSSLNRRASLDEREEKLLPARSYDRLSSMASGSGGGTGGDSDVFSFSLLHVLQLAQSVMVRTPSKEGRRLSSTALTTMSSAVQTEAAEAEVTSASSNLAPPVLVMGGVWKEAVETLQVHSSDIAHDMKNPLNGVLALSQNVVAGVFGELPQPALDQLNVVRACAYHLLNMINMMRDMMKMLASGDPEISVNMATLDNHIEEVLKRMSAMVGSRLTIKYTNKSATPVLADDQRLYQVLHCVMANAFKYTRKGSVMIDTQESEDKKYLTFLVSDTGTGFSRDQLEKFNSPLSGTCKEEMGLGLAMVKRLMACFGGLLRISNRPEGGGLVELCFKTDRNAPDLSSIPPRPAITPADSASLAVTPLSVANTQPPTAPPALKEASPPQVGEAAHKLQGSMPPLSAPVVPDDHSKSLPVPASTSAGVGSAKGSHHQPQRASIPGEYSRANESGSKSIKFKGSDSGVEENAGAKVLIVDDDPVNLTILEDLLRSAGYDIISAATGNEALEVFVMADPPVQLVLLDVTLPDMSGHEVCLKMRTLIPGIPPPIIMISGKASTNDVIKGLQAGSCDYITKPFQPQEVLARVETQLRLFMGEVQQLQETAERNMALLTQVLPPHVLASLKGGSRVMVEKFNDVCLLMADIVNFQDIAGHADTADCILTLNRIYSTFDSLMEKYNIHKIDVVDDVYVAAVGHLREDQGLGPSLLVRNILDCGREMLEVVRTMPFPPNLGKMELRIGVHVGPLFAGVVGVKFPRYILFGTTAQLTRALRLSALPMTVHVSETVYGRVKGTGTDTFVNYTKSSFAGMGIVRTLLLLTDNVDVEALQDADVAEYLASTAQGMGRLQVLRTLVGTQHEAPAAVLAGQSSQYGMPSRGLYSAYRRGRDHDSSGSLTAARMAMRQQQQQQQGGDGQVTFKVEDGFGDHHLQQRSPNNSFSPGGLGAGPQYLRDKSYSITEEGQTFGDEDDDNEADGERDQQRRGGIQSRGGRRMTGASGDTTGEEEGQEERTSSMRSWTRVESGLLEQLGFKRTSGGFSRQQDPGTLVLSSSEALSSETAVHSEATKEHLIASQPVAPSTSQETHIREAIKSADVSSVSSQRLEHELMPAVDAGKWVGAQHGRGRMPSATEIDEREASLSYQVPLASVPVQQAPGSSAAGTAATSSSLSPNKWQPLPPASASSGRPRHQQQQQGAVAPDGGQAAVLTQRVQQGQLLSSSASSILSIHNLERPGYSPKTPSDVLTHLGIGYYAKAVEAHGLSLAQFAALDDTGLKKLGLITVRSRQAVTEELRALGLK
ncbi:hypothetical protein CEUSTIGMA_g10109.t1 [Chlamydomonas eustigma]|uniref:histidine kinase n=1 Tax=Chlamydomonas eustigma TaxID=1157962 RepID=A0A250XI08_9CHLO|nr:hypothetical protein CEUSTIGMA_g10109.t1 [Chlamydomonas eustigma]|eukprot:GAX82683.1 hypothetical protein CEUSTIGMA_g10109.t1 [Chlamydomonas eustigma]